MVPSRDERAIARQKAAEENLARLHELIGQIRAIRVSVDATNVRLVEKIEKAIEELYKSDKETNR